MSGQLPGWLADRLGVQVPANADAATWQLDSAWKWAPWVTLVVILAAITWTVSIYSRESSSAGRAYRALLVGLRLSAIGLVLIMLAQWALALRLTGPPALAIVVDRSASMGIADRYEDSAFSTQLNERLISAGLTEPTRLNTATLLLTENDARLLRELAERYRMAAYVAAGDVQRVSVSSSPVDLAGALRGISSQTPSSQATRIGDALMRVLDDFRGAPPAAVVLLSDGVVTDGVSLADAAQNMRKAGVPLVAVGLGSSKAPRDIELADVLVDDVVFVDDLVSLQVQIKATGLEGQSAKVTLRRDDDSTPVMEEPVVLPAAGKTLAMQLTDRPTKPGVVKYVVEIAPREDETNKNNNRQTRTVSVRDEKIRVLLVQGYPNYEFRFLKTMLERDRAVKLATYLQDADPDYAEQDKTALRGFPVNQDELLAYDVIIIGDVDPSVLPQSVWQSVRTFVSEKGGGAAFIAGPRFFPWLYGDKPDIRAILPIQLDAVAPSGEHTAQSGSAVAIHPTPIGLQNPAFQLGDSPSETIGIWNKLAPVYWLMPVGQLKAGGEVLAEGGGKPAILFQYVGAGRVLFHAIDSTWRWRSGAGDRYFARYWVQTIRFLARGKLSKGRGVQLLTDRREYRRGETAQLKVRFLDPQLAPAGDEVTVLVEATGQARRRVTLRRNPSIAGTYEGSLSELTDGHYEVLMVEPQLPGNPVAARFSVAAPLGEFARLEMDEQGLKVAAETTHGKFFTVADADRLLAELPAGRRVPIESLPPIPIWNRWWMLAAFLSCITTEWILRKRKGML